jgi:hypothetical protein
VVVVLLLVVVLLRFASSPTLALPLVELVLDVVVKTGIVVAAHNAPTQRHQVPALRVEVLELVNSQISAAPQQATAPRPLLIATQIYVPLLEEVGRRHAISGFVHLASSAHMRQRQ